MKQLALCISRTALPEHKHNTIGIYPFELKDIENDQFHLINREVCDTKDTGSDHFIVAATLPQILGYAVITRGDEVLTYSRSKTGGEVDLHAKRSIGFGGHVDLADLNDSFDTFDSYAAAVCSALCREMKEELNSTIDWPFPDDFTEILIDTTNLVGMAHVGLPIFFDISNENQNIEANHEICDPRWVSKADLLATVDQYENWSQILIQRGTYV